MRAVVLGLDTGVHGGWSIHAGAVELSGVARSAKDRQTVVATAVRKAEANQVPLLVVFEDHSKMPLKRKTRGDRRHRGAPERSTASVLGMGGARDRWHEQLDLVEHPMSWRMKVEPKRWRQRFGFRGNTDSLKRQACTWASNETRRTITDHNEAEAICLSCWGAIDGLTEHEAKRELERVKAKEARERRKGAA